MKLAGFDITESSAFFLISGPCVIESEQICFDIAGRMTEITRTLGIPYIFKASFDKANRTSGTSYRGLGREQGLEILAKIRHKFGIPVLTDVHNIEDIASAASVVDILQTPAFLCRQTDFIQTCAATGKFLNIKKGQFLAPSDMQNIVNKAHTAAVAAGVTENTILVCERGVSFGYNNLVSDMRSLAIMRKTGCPVVFDATHSVQLPGAHGNKSGGQHEFVPILARAAIAVGVHGVFMETHPNPVEALSDGANSLPLEHMPKLLEHLLNLDLAVKQARMFDFY